MGGYLISRGQIWLSAQSLLKLEVLNAPLEVCPWSICVALKVFLAPLEVLGFRVACAYPHSFRQIIC